VTSDIAAYDISRLGLKLEQSVLSDIDVTRLFFSSSHATDTVDGIDNHIFCLVRMIVRF
jgi:hypothetical protein